MSGIVQDGTGAVVSNAQVVLLTSQRAAVASTRTDAGGTFTLAGIPRGSYILAVSHRGFAVTRTPVELPAAQDSPITVVLSLQPLRNQVTVTANAGTAEDSAAAVQPVSIVDEEGIRERAMAVLAQAANEEVGVSLQRTSPTIAGIFVRGLTGNKVSVFVDGVRYSTAAMRGGINTFFDLIDPSSLQSLEILRGPNSAQYGSDAIGGSLQLLSRVPAFSATERPALSGTLDTLFSSPDAGFGGNVAANYGMRNFAIMVNLAGHRSSRLRAGHALDSHAAVTRFLGVSSKTYGDERLPDTGFTQYSGMIRLNWAPTPRSQVTAHYSRGQMDGGKRHDQLLGGDGNLVADLRNFMLDLAYLRYSRFGLGWLDQFTVTYSFNSQREERVNQGGNGNPKAAINHEYERTTVNGFQLQAQKRWAPRQNLSMGADYYHERITAPSYGWDPVKNVSTVRRGRVPDNARYDSGGAYLQNSYDAVRDRLRLVGSIRISAAAYGASTADSPLVSGKPLWPDDSLRTSDFTFRGGLVVTLAPPWKLYADVSRGFRAPHITDLGTTGITGSGFEVAAPDLVGWGGTLGSTAGTDAVNTGIPVAQVTPEWSLNYEGGLRFNNRTVSADFAFFVNDINESVTKQSLILPQGAVGRVLAGQVIIAQNPNGVVFVAAATNPVLVRANYDDARIKGVEHSLDWQPRTFLSLGTRFTWISANDTRTGLPPNIEGGTPAPDGFFRIRYAPGSARFWLEPYVHAAGRQEHLSSLDLADRRTGAVRTRSSIRSFFLNGATARGYVGPGPDGIPGSADDRLLATGETLAQVQDRVLGVGVQSAPLFLAVPGTITFNLRAGLRVNERQDLLVDFSNIADRNYRGISWGLDAPGRAVSVRYRVKW